MHALASTAALTKIVLLTPDANRPEILTGLRLGVWGVLLRDCPPSVLVKCIRHVRAGEHWIGRERVSDVLLLLRRMTKESGTSAGHQPLTPRELEIVQQVASGCGNREIARRFQISDQTVKNHLSHIFQKLRVRSRVQLALYAAEQGLLGSRHR